jgi:hypothetical protein
MKFTVETLKPRNPLVAASRLRRAGSHRAGEGARRQQAGRALRLELERLRPSP